MPCNETEHPYIRSNKESLTKRLKLKEIYLMTSLAFLLRSVMFHTIFFDHPDYLARWKPVPTICGNVDTLESVHKIWSIIKLVST